MSEQLLEEAAQRRQLQQQDAERGGAAPRDLAGREMLRTAALVGGVAAGLALVSMLLPPVLLLLWLWVVGAPVAALGLYLARHRETLPNASFGARLGFLSGLAVALALATVNIGSLLLLRFAWHRPALVDAPIAAIFTQMRATTEAQYGAAMVAPLGSLLAIPEFRAGLLMASLSMFTVGYLLLATAGGAFAGILRARTARS